MSFPPGNGPHIHPEVAAASHFHLAVIYNCRDGRAAVSRCYYSFFRREFPSPFLHLCNNKLKVVLVGDGSFIAVLPADSDTGTSLQGSGCFTIMTSCVSLIPPLLRPALLPPRSSSIFLLVFCLPSSLLHIFHRSCFPVRAVHIPRCPPFTSLEIEPVSPPSCLARRSGTSEASRRIIKSHKITISHKSEATLFPSVQQPQGGFGEADTSG